MNIRLFRSGHQKLARPIRLTSTRLLSWTRSLNDEEKSLKDRVKILKTNDDYVTLPNWVPLVGFLSLVYKLYEHAVEYSLALKQLESLAQKSADKIELIDRNNDLNKIQHDVANAKNIDEISKCRAEIEKIEKLLREAKNNQTQAMESQNRSQDEIKRNMRTLYDAIQKLNQNHKAGSSSSTSRSSSSSSSNSPNWFEIQRNIKTRLNSSPQE